jgi:hypothetical protein
MFFLLEYNPRVSCSRSDFAFSNYWIKHNFENIPIFMKSHFNLV